MFTKDGYHKALTSKTGDDAYILLGNGGHKKLTELLESASLGASGNSTTLSITVAGTTKSNSITVPYAAVAGSANSVTWANVTSKPSSTGNSTQPIYWNGSTFVACTAYADASVNYANNADKLDNIDSTGFLRWKCMENIGSSSPFQNAVDYFNNLSNLNNGATLVYNHAGGEYTELFTRRNDSTGHGSILKWGYPDRYIRIIRMISGTAQSTDWEKIYAGYADSAGAVAWNNVSSKPDTATRWPTWAEVTSKPGSTGSSTQPVYWNGSTFVACTAYADASVNYAKYAGYATRLDGGSIAGWGTLTTSNGYSVIAAYDYGDKGAFCWAGKSGQMYMQVDGWFYQNEGRYRVLDENNYSSYIDDRYVNVTGDTMQISSGIILNALYATDILGYNPSYGTYIGGNFGSSGSWYIYSGNASHSGGPCCAINSNIYDILHSGNYTTYTVKKDGTGASGTWGINITGSAGSATYAGYINVRDTGNYGSEWNTVKSSTYPLRMLAYDVYNNGGPETYGNVLEITGISGHWEPQLWFGAWTSGHIAYRNKDYASSSFGSWKWLIDTENWTSYIGTSSAYVGYASYATSAGSTNIITRIWQRGNDCKATDDFPYNNQTRFYMYDSTTSNRPTGASGFMMVSGWDWGPGGSILAQNFDDGDYGRLYTACRPCGGSWSDWRKVAFTTDIPSSLPANGGNSDTVDNYHASQLWRSDGGTWNPSANITLNASANGQEWSFDIYRNGYTGCYWHVWDSSRSTMLQVTSDDGKVRAPYGFVGNLEGNASSASSVAWGNVTGKPDNILTNPYTGHVQITGRVFGYNYGNQGSNAVAFMWDKPGSYYTGMGPNGVTNQIHFGPCNADGTWVSGFSQQWDFQGNVYATNFYTTSDRTKKINIESIASIVPIRKFNWKQDGSLSYGFIAQELVELGHEELVHGTEGNMTVNYDAALSFSMAKLSNYVERLEHTVEELKNENSNLKSRIEDLYKLIVK